MSSLSNQQVEHQPANVPCLFFSYARNDVDSYLKQFCEDLFDMVAQKGTFERGKGEGSFQDIQNIEPGQDWETKIAKALQHSQVLVCAYTPWY